MIQRAIFNRLRSLSTHRDYLYNIRLLYSSYEYKCGMLGEKCTNLLLSLDGVESHGSEAIRKERKALVNRILHFQDYCIATHVPLRRKYYT